MKEQEKIIYYHFDWLNSWFVLNTVLTIIFLSCIVKCLCYFCWQKTVVSACIIMFSWLLWGYKYLLKHIMAVITEDSIKIDHTAPLKWKDIKNAEEKIIWCCFKKRRVIILNPKSGIDYDYNFLQKHNGAFTPFSIPLYGILTSEDEKKITEIIAEKVKLKKLK